MKIKAGYKSNWQKGAVGEYFTLAIRSIHTIDKLFPLFCIKQEAYFSRKASSRSLAKLQDRNFQVADWILTNELQINNFWMRS